MGISFCLRVHYVCYPDHQQGLILSEEYSTMEFGLSRFPKLINTFSHEKINHLTVRRDNNRDVVGLYANENCCI
jgi:hypothetical protein